MAKQVHPAKRSLKVIVAVLLVTLVFGSLAQAAPIAQNPTLSVYGMTLSPQDIELCVGHGELFIVTVPLNETLQIGNQAPYNYKIYYSGETVTAEVRDERVGTVTPPQLDTSVVRGGLTRSDDPLVPLVPTGLGIGTGTNWRVGFVNSPQQLWFYFTAKEKGTTIIEFKHASSFMRFPRAATLTAQVEVVDCWEAYATGLWTGNASNEWTKKDICSLERPFVLEGNGESEAFGMRTVAKSRAYFFWPSSGPFGVLGLTALQDGRYIYVGQNILIPPVGKPASCTSVGSGSYQQFIYEGRTPLEGNLILNGSVDTYCEGEGFHTPQDAIQVAFRALGAGNACEESLPGLNP